MALFDDKMSMAMALSGLQGGLQNLGNMQAVQRGAQPYMRQTFDPMQMMQVQMAMGERDRERKAEEALRGLFGGTPTVGAGTAPVPTATGPAAGIPGAGPVSPPGTPGAPTAQPGGLFGGLPPQVRQSLMALGQASPEKALALGTQLSAETAMQKPTLPKHLGGGVFMKPDGTTYSDPLMFENLQKLRSAGAGRTSVTLSPTITTGTQTAIEKQSLSAQDQLASLESIERSFKPEFLTYGSQLQQWGLGKAGKLGMKLTPEQDALRTDYSQFRRRTVENLTTKLKALSGVAVNPEEFKRTEQTTPSMTDDPAEFKAKLDDSIALQKAAVIRYRYALVNNLEPLNMGVDLQKLVHTAKKHSMTYDQVLERLLGAGGG